MKALIPVILCVIIFEAEASSKKAILFNLKTRCLDDVCRENGDEPCPSFLTACPASTPQELQFNNKFSLGRRSLFSRLIYAKGEVARNILTDFCENSAKPTLLYNTQDGKYEIGYELYFEDEKINRLGFNMTYKNHHCYRPVKTKKTKNYGILNVTVPSLDDIFIRYEDENNVKFNFTLEHQTRTLVFYWIKVLSIKSFGLQKSIEIQYDAYMSSDNFENLRLRETCGNFSFDDDDLYTVVNKENQEIYLSFKSNPISREGNPGTGCDHIYGCLEISQIVPLWYFKSNSAKFASCSHMNTIPVWKSIADVQLRKVDLYIIATFEELQPDVIFGVSGALQMKTPTSFKLGRRIYLFDAKHHQMVPIPKIIYRIVVRKLDTGDKYFAAIIIHNDPTADPIRDKLCSTNETLSGWDKITNDDPRTGLTYVCPITEQLNNELKVHDNLTLHKNGTLSLNSVPYYSYLSGRRYYWDKVSNINSRFKKLVEASKIYA